MRMLVWITVVALASVGCDKKGKSPFGGADPAPSAAKGSAAPTDSAASAGSAATGSAAAGSAAIVVAAGSAAAGSGSGSGSAAPAAPAAVEVGEHVMAQWTNGRWYPGKIFAITDAGTYDVNYDDGDKSKGLPRKKIRKKGEVAAASASGGGGGGHSTASSDAPCPGPGLTRRCGGRCVNIQEDNNNCGSCGNRCSDGKHCDGHLFCRDADGNL